MKPILIARANRPILPPHRALRIAQQFEATIAVVLCFLSLFIFKVVSVFSAAVKRASRLLGADKLLTLRPALAAFGGLSGALFACLPQTAKLLTALGGWPLREATFLAGLALIVDCAPQALARATRLKVRGEREEINLIEDWFRPRMIQPADAVWPNVVLIISILVVPAIVSLSFPDVFGVRALAVYCAVIWVTWKTANDFEHADSHYHFFRRHRGEGMVEKCVFRILDLYLTYIFILALARVPHWYEVQHVVVHHAEDNGADDTQSTLAYDRASFIDFARCSNRFALSGLVSIDVFRYLIKRRRTKAIRRLAAGMALFYGMIATGLLINWKFAITIIVVRYVGGILSSMGFFQEHGIVDTTEPGNIYRNSLHYIAPDNTHGSRGEDFHIAHHLRPGRHWAEYESHVASDLGRYAEERAVGFLDGPGHIDIYYKLLWRRDFTSLASYFVLFGRPGISTDEMAGLLRSRTLPLGAQERGQADRPLDLFLGRGAGCLLS